MGDLSVIFFILTICGEPATIIKHDPVMQTTKAYASTDMLTSEDVDDFFEGFDKSWRAELELAKKDACI